MRRRAGFTLVELLVALFITAIMFTIGYRGLDQALTSRRALEQQSARLIAVQQAMRTIEQDFELLQPRPVRQPIGDGYLPALLSTQAIGANAPLGSASAGLGSASSGTGNGLGSSVTLGSGTASTGSSMTLGSGTAGTGSSLNGTAAPIVTLTRGSWTNPVGLPRSELQRVSYSIENGALVRSYWPVLDATTPVAPLKRTLVDRVKSFSLRYMDAGRTWQSAWPPGALGAAPANQTLRLRPVAVEVTLELEDWGVLLRYIEVPG
jgi:prepilin-type N-terminal cleavage/methylation domain-containing protein